LADGWRGHNPLPELGYLHHVVREDYHVGENLLPLVNRVASLLKRWLLGTHRGAVRASHLDYYLESLRSDSTGDDPNPEESFSTGSSSRPS
jgi:hypothetical protein